MVRMQWAVGHVDHYEGERGAERLLRRERAGGDVLFYDGADFWPLVFAKDKFLDFEWYEPTLTRRVEWMCVGSTVVSYCEIQGIVDSDHSAPDHEIDIMDTSGGKKKRLGPKTTHNTGPLSVDILCIKKTSDMHAGACVAPCCSATTSRTR